MSSNSTVLSVRGLSKTFKIAHNNAKPATTVEALFQTLRRKATRTETFRALNDVSFDIDQGEVVGIIGRNGAGKSTLLKIISQITEPTTGEIDLYGRVASLLEVGTGFHPELTGRENVFLNGAILGMTRAEIRTNFDDIVSFAEVEKFIDTPVKHYSSGMYVRLAFAVAAHLQSEVLIVDEVLAVGDAKFQEKCLNKMDNVAKQGRTVLLVSHRNASIQSLCSRVIWIDKGSVEADGAAEPVINSYVASLFADGKSAKGITSACGAVDIVGVNLKNENGEVTNLFRPGGKLTVEVDYFAREKVVLPYLWIGCSGRSGVLFAAQMLLDGFRPQCLEGRGQIRCTFEELPLLPHQSYNLQISGMHQDAHSLLFTKTEVARFSVIGSAAELGFDSEVAERAVEHASAAVLVPYSWQHSDGRSFALNPLTYDKEQRSRLLA